MRLGFIRSRPYRSSGTHLVSRNLRGSTTRATSPQTRTSFPFIRLALDSWAIPRMTKASPHLTHLHHHPSSLRRPFIPVLPQTLRTRCSPSLSGLTHSGMRPRSTESSLPRIWRRCVLTCRQSWPIRPSFYSSSSLCRPSSLSSWLSTSLHHLHRSDHQGSPLPSIVFILPVWTLDILFGGGGGGECGDRVSCFCVFFIAWF